ncbi:MAG TPA: ABC transporter permease [Vicinamibacterales bacterium]|nr:ABC transporter permease [Vicinamibacterales bacterium]
MTPLLAMVRKDLQVFFSDRRAVIMSFIVPIAIASFFGSIFSGPGNNNEPAKIAIAVIDNDGSGISKGIVTGLDGDRNLRVSQPSEADAREAVKKGKTSVAIIIPKGFGDAAGPAFFRGGEKPPLDLVYDPSHNVEFAMVRGILTEHVMQAVSKEMFTGAQGRQYVEQTIPQIQQSSNLRDDQKRVLVDLLQSVVSLNRQAADGAGSAPGLTLPYTVREQAMTSGNVAYNGYAHSFAGMGIQFLLFAAANLGIEILLERQKGLWKRLRSAPVSRLMLLAGKTASGAIISLMTLLVSFAFAMVVFKVRIAGSVVGFLAVSIACSIMAATFGLLIASLGKTPASARGVTTLAVLMMVMLGGAWVPTFIFPAWLQQLTVVVPARWAVDGLDAMTWRGVGLSGAVMPTVILLAFAAAFAGVAVNRFRWEEA